jgi:hypothetical protein
VRRLKPILFIAFANDVENPAENLEGLRREYANIQAAFAFYAGGDGSCELLTNAACTGDGLVEPFYRNQVVIFHYAGHASPDALLLQTADGHNAPASRDRFAQFLALQSRLRLVFLNACMTREWAEQLVRLGVCVVATSRCIPDSIAPDFANAFYREIAQDRTIAEAFEEASRGCASAKENHAGMRGFAAAEDDHATEGLPWALYGSEAARTWRLSDDAHDPAIGLPPLDPRKYQLPRESPYVTIEGHQEKDARIFFGRNAEVRRLYDWIMKPTAQPLLIFYGQSGVGKSSLLRAGLLPRLSGPEVIQYARHGADLGADLDRALAAQAASDAEWLASAVPRVIVLDQVEEAILHGGKDEMSRFADRLKELFAAYPQESKARLILSFRKEYLAEMRALLAEHLPGLGTELFLERLDQEGIRQVVLGPVSSQDARDLYRLKISEEFAQFVADKLDDGRSSVATVLQIILGRLWEEAKKRADECGAADREYTEPLYREVVNEAQGPLTQFLDQQMAQLRDRGWQAEVDGGLELDLLLEHTTDFTTARRIPAEELQQMCYPDVSRLAALVEHNKELHLLSEVQDEPGQPAATSLAHDQLATAVRAEWNLSQLPGARARRIIENRARSWGETKGGDPLDGADLRVVERGLRQMRALDPRKHEIEMVAASRERRRKLRQAWIVWPSVAAVVIGCIFALAQASRIAQDRIGALTATAKNALGNDDFATLLLSMQAAVNERDSWALRVTPDKKIRTEVQSVLLNSLETYHESGLYYFDFYDFSYDDVGDCATSFGPRSRLLFRTVLQGQTFHFGSRQASFGGRKIPDDLLSRSFPITCDPATGRVSGLEEDKGSSTALVRLWKDGVERSVHLDWNYGLPNKMVVSHDGKRAAFTFRDRTAVVGADFQQVDSTQFDPGVGIPVSLAFSSDDSILAATGPKGMTWIDSQSGKTELRCPGSYGLFRFVKVAGREFAAVVNMTLSNRVAIDFWSVPPASNPGLARCEPFASYQPDPTYEMLAPVAMAFDASGAVMALEDPDGFVSLYPVPSALTGTRHSSGQDSHRFPPPLIADLPSGSKARDPSRPEAIRFLGLRSDLSLYATQQPMDPLIRVWPVRGRDIQAVIRGLNQRKPLSTDYLLSIACGELSIYLNEDDSFRVNPASKWGIDLHALHAGCIGIPKPAVAVTH